MCLCSLLCYQFLVSTFLSSFAGSCWPSTLWGNWWHHSLQGWGLGWHGARGKISRRPFYEFPSTYWDSWREQFWFSAHGSQCSQRKEWSTSIGTPWGLNFTIIVLHKYIYSYSQHINIIISCSGILTILRSLILMCYMKAGRGWAKLGLVSCLFWFISLFTSNGAFLPYKIAEL